MAEKNMAKAKVGAPKGRRQLVVVGGVAGGMSAAAKAKREDPSLEVTVFEKSGYISYGACGMPYVIGGEITELSELVSRTSEAMREQGVEVKVYHEVTGVDYLERRVQVTDLGTEACFSVPFDVLLLATGALPVHPELPGMDLQGVHVLRRIEDAEAVQRTLKRTLQRGAKRAVVVGGGYIGLEMAEAFVRAGLEVTVLEQQGSLLTNFGPKPAQLALEEVAAHAEVMLNTSLKRLEGDGCVEHVVTGEGTFPADIVLVSVGVRPNNTLAKNLGLTLGPAGAVLTDAQLRTNLAEVYAVGDLTAAHHLVTGEAAWVPLGDTANKQGRVAGTVIGGGEASFRGIVGIAVTKVFGRAFAATGLTLEAAKEAGFDALSCEVETTDHAGYYPDKRSLHLTLVWEDGSERLLGAQIVGYGDAVKRIDVIAALLFHKGTLRDLADLDLAYAPPFSSAWDPLLIAANVATGGG